MTRIYPAGAAIPLLLCLGVAACATFHPLEVRYRLPAASRILEGVRMSLTVEDGRREASVLGPAAARQFKNFPGEISFTIDDPEGATVAQGYYRVMEMVGEALRRRIERTGVSLSPAPAAEGLELLVVLKELTLDLAGERWVARIGFQGRLMKGGKLLATQEVAGEAERHRIMARREAHRAASDIVTDAVNRFDLPDLVRQAETAHPGLVDR